MTNTTTTPAAPVTTKRAYKKRVVKTAKKAPAKKKKTKTAKTKTVKKQKAPRTNRTNSMPEVTRLMARTVDKVAALSAMIKSEVVALRKTLR